MAETRAERLARIRAVLDADESEIEVSVAEDTSGAWCRDGAFRSLLIDDLRWLLSQVSDTLEYRVEMWLDHAAEPGWFAATSQTGSKAWAEHHVSQYGPGKYRVVSAPVQVWTPAGVWRVVP